MGFEDRGFEEERDEGEQYLRDVSAEGEALNEIAIEEEKRKRQKKKVRKQK